MQAHQHGATDEPQAQQQYRATHDQVITHRGKLTLFDSRCEMKSYQDNQQRA
jgi:hypothetical protein